MSKRQRSCVACGLKTDKMALFRFVRDGQGSVSFDLSGKEPGRGAYVCSPACLEKAIRSKRLERMLRTSLSPEDHRRIIEELATAIRGV